MNQRTHIHAVAAAAALLATVLTLTAGAGNARAAVLQMDPSGSHLDGVALSKGATATVQGRQLELTTVGSGLRSKKIAFVNIKVYVAQLLVSEPSSFVRTDNGALDSVAAMSGAAIRMDFLRSVDADSVQGAFRDSFAANQVDQGRPEIKAFLDAVTQGGDADNGKSLTLVIEKLPHGQDAVTYEDSRGQATTITGPAGFGRAILSIWLGTPADNGVANLKRALIGGGA